MKALLRGVAARLRTLATPSADEMEKGAVAQGLLHAKMNRSRAKITSLADVEWSVFSQWGEDGIIAWLIDQMPTVPPVFVEFGVQNYREANTRMLLHLRNW